MTDKTTSIEDRESFQMVEHSPLARAVRELRERFGLVGCVLIDFTAERVGVCHSGKTDEFNQHMATLGARILAAIDDGKFDPEEPNG